MRKTHKNAPLCTCGHRIIDHASHGGSFRFPVFAQCKVCACNKYRSDGKPRQTNSQGAK